MKATNRGLMATATAGCVALTNLISTSAVARISDISEFGVFALTFSFYLVGTGLSGAMVVEELLTDADWSSRFNSWSSRVILLGVLFGVCIAAIGLWLREPMMLVLALALPGLTLHDYIQKVGMAVASVGVSMGLQSMWLLGSIVIFMLSLVSDPEPVLLFGLWASIGSLAGFGGALALKLNVVPRWRRDTVSTQKILGFGVEYAAGRGVAQATPSLVAATSGLANVAAMRGAGTLLGPLTVMVGAARVLLFPRISGSARQLRTAATSAAILVGIVGVPGVAIVFTPVSVGTFVLGDVWEPAARLLPVLLVELLFVVAAIPALVLHRARGHVGRAIRIQFGIGPLRLMSVFVGSTFYGAFGAAVALLITSGVACLAWWFSAAAQGVRYN